MGRGARIVLPLAAVVACASGFAAAGRPGAQQVDGKAIFRGKGNCAVCHGPDGRGTALGPDLADPVWIHVATLSPQAVAELVRAGVPKPERHPAPMPPMGGARLSEEELLAVAAYVLSLSEAER